MREYCTFYICPICFNVAEEPGKHHGRERVFCEELPVGDEKLKPILDNRGDLKTHAPRWFLEAVWKAAGIEEYPF